MHRHENKEAHKHVAMVTNMYVFSIQNKEALTKSISLPTSVTFKFKRTISATK